MSRTALSDRLAALVAARETRTETLALLADTLTYLRRHLDYVDGEIDGSLSRINNPCRYRPGMMLHVRWGAVPQDAALGPAGLDWFARNPDRTSLWRRTRKPTRANLEARCEPAFLPVQVAALDRLAEHLELRSRARACIAAVAAAVPRSSHRAPSNDPSPIVRCSAARAELIDEAVQYIQSAELALDALDEEIDDLRKQFNRRAQRKTVSLVCAWECDGRSLERLIGPRGPVFMMVTTGLAGRRPKRVTAPKGSNHNPITTRLLKQSRYTKDADAIRVLAEQIVELRLRRNDFAATLKAVARAVSSINAQLDSIQ